MTTTALSDLRYAVAAALEGDTPAPADATVHADVVDALTPPAYLLVWGDPWLEPTTFCTHAARLDIICIAGRIEPAPGIETIEYMVATAINRLRAANLPEAAVSVPARFDIGGVAYLAARLSIVTRLQVAAPAVPVPPTPAGLFDDPAVMFDDTAYAFDGYPISV